MDQVDPRFNQRRKTMTGFIMMLLMTVAFLGMARANPEVCKDISRRSLVGSVVAMIITAFGLNYLFSVFPVIEELVWHIWAPVELLAIVLLFALGPMIHRKAEQQRRIEKAKNAWTAQI